ncbi:DUF1707 domain-containing protein [Rhodococcus hoagii]|uniref:DUF1707 SHOCT-like domain-containing protein n=1 Tax=Rhodococcus hoagii TaxID=43767 RepID=UPI0019E9DB89|nr:DUF1707 domain-containing protein [Prescottella equi]NKR98241.1 DUF1707 domain-containing protein [Prescottella equi]BCN60312.1 hypothetical protein RE9427_36820 [Prescottella equi]
MPDPRSDKTRARDIDRAQTCSLLDAAYADGQLGVEEHESRTAAAMRATTLGALRALTKDLQVPDHLVGDGTGGESETESDSGSPRSRHILVVLAAVVVVALIVVGLVQVMSAGGSNGPAASSESSADDHSAESIALFTADGMREFVRRFESKFGNLVADDVDLYRDDAVVAKMIPRQPTRMQRWMFTGAAGFEPWTPPTMRDEDQDTVDLALLDSESIADLVGRATGLVGLPSGHVDRVAIRALRSPSGVAEPRVTVYVVDADVAKGNVTATFTGEVVEVQGP